MLRRRSRTVWLGVAFVAGLALLTVGISGQSTPRPGTTSGDWPHYNADLRGTRYSPLDQINGSNFSTLQVAWRFKTDHLGPRPEYKLEGTPLAVRGVLFTTGGTRRSVIALDGKTGELIWAHSLREGKRAAVAPRQLSGRGVAYWTDGRTDERILYVTTGYRLVELNAKTGAMINSFGTDGVLDLKVGVVKSVNQQIDLETGEIGVHSTPTVTGDVVHGDTPDYIRNHPALKGLTIPKTGQPGTSGVGLMVTKTLVVMGDAQITAPSGRQRGAMLRAYDKKTGEEVGAILMPAPQSGSPMTYSVDGKQYIVVAVSGGPYSGEYLAFTLPN